MKILLTLMVKNESRILQRCLEAGSRHADAVIVCDTGSTDNTREIAEGFKDRPTKVVVHTWKNFGHNRSLSFAAAYQYAKELGWDLSESYAMVLDGDMVLRGEDPHEKLESRANSYRIIQKGSSLEYYNTRFMRLDLPWKCVGVTHEYWDGPGEGQKMEGVWIDDIGDGGAKADKFERDIRLLTQGLKDEPTNGRYMFYLAQTYKDMGRHDDAIAMYKKRIAVGGWEEEVWFSHYAIAQCYLRKRDELKGELWAQRAYLRRPTRAEPLQLLVRHFREKPADQFKAWHYLRLQEKIRKPDDLLFVEPHAYKELPDYERTVLHYYISEDRAQGMDLCIRHINQGGIHSDGVFSNTLYYSKSLPCTWKRLEFTPPEGFVASSIAVSQDLRVNVRTHNYTITPTGEYKNPGTVETRNFSGEWDPLALEVVGWNEVVVPEDTPRREDLIHGLEDIRLQTGGIFTATTKEYSYGDMYRVVMGTYPDLQFRPIRPPTETGCEKNWLPIDSKTVLYQWYPFQVGTIVEDRLEITHTHEVPPWFRYFRGSVPPFEYRGELWTMVHLVHYSSPRKYMHAFVVLDKETYRPTRMSRPFTFRHWGVEYCLGAYLLGETLQVFVSVWDRESWVGSIPMSECVQLLRPVSDA